MIFVFDDNKDDDDAGRGVCDMERAVARGDDGATFADDDDDDDDAKADDDNADRDRTEEFDKEKIGFLVDERTR